MKPFIDICQGFWPDMQLEGLLNIYFQKCSERTLSVTASGSTKIIKLSPKSLETSFFSWNIRLTIDKFSNKEIKKEFFGHITKVSEVHTRMCSQISG